MTSAPQPTESNPRAPSLRSMPIRNRLIAGSIAIVFLAIAIMGGLIVATVLTLLFLPALYALWFRVGRGETAVGNAGHAV